MNISELKEKIIAGYRIDKQEAMELVEAELEELCAAANDIRKRLCGNGFDICTIINGKSGNCSEDCKYCAQSCHFKSEIKDYPLLPAKDMIEEAKYNESKGILRYSVVTSGKRLSKKEVDKMCENYKELSKETNIRLCGSHGLLDYEDFVKLKEAGIVRYHNNLETSERYFKDICTTHTYEEKKATIRAAMKAGISVCSGGIMGLGEDYEDRIEMALAIRELGVKSVPINILNPIKGTPLENNPVLTLEEVRRIVAIYRFILPDSAIRMAGGRGLMADKGRSIFMSGANAAISGDMLTTSGISIAFDMEMIKELGFEPRCL